MKLFRIRIFQTWNNVMRTRFGYILCILDKSCVTLQIYSWFTLKKRLVENQIYKYFLLISTIPGLVQTEPHAPGAAQQHARVGCVKFWKIDLTKNSSCQIKDFCLMNSMPPSVLKFFICELHLFCLENSRPKGGQQNFCQQLLVYCSQNKSIGHMMTKH